MDIKNQTYVFGTYKFKEDSLNDTLKYSLFFREIIKSSDENYQLRGGFSTIGDEDPKAPFLGSGSEDILCGIIQNKALGKIEVLYSDNKTITYNLGGSDYYLIYRKDNPYLKIVRTSFYDKENKLINKPSK